MRQIDLFTTPGSLGLEPEQTGAILAYDVTKGDVIKTVVGQRDPAPIGRVD